MAVRGDNDTSAERLRYERVVRLGSLVILAAVLALGAKWWADGREVKRDLARGKRWRASSRYGSEGCVSPAQQCRSEFFFSTNEQADPWLEIDLGTEVSFSDVRVLNREDCCGERALPLIVELRSEAEPYHEVARRTSAFVSWDATFAVTKARFVRLRVPRWTDLHLRRVLVFP